MGAGVVSKPGPTSPVVRDPAAMTGGLRQMVERMHAASSTAGAQSKFVTNMRTTGKQGLQLAIAVTHQQAAIDAITAVVAELCKPRMI